MSAAGRHRTLLVVLVIAGWLIGFSGLFAVFVLNSSRDHKIERIQAQEAWARYDGLITVCSRGNTIRILLNAQTNSDLPIVHCYDSIPRPQIPRPKETT